MCGIAGYVASGPAPPDPELVDRLLGGVRERGPDGEGVCMIEGGSGRATALRTERSPDSCADLPDLHDRASWPRHDVVLAHVRYAVMDRSDDSHQPLVRPDLGVVLAFQGEIFNYPELRDELEGLGHDFHSSGDTEVLAVALRAWGDEAWSRLNGFWAAAAYDARARRLVLSRDRLGIAPLYVAEDGDRRLFGSSPLGLAEALREGARPRRSGLVDFLATGMRDFDGRTLFERVRAVEPGTLEALPLASDERAWSTVRFWSLPASRLSARELPLPEATSRLRDALTSAVELRLRGEREVAFQLSGGLDSTSVIAVAATLRSEPLPTYTVSVPEEDEEPFARTMTKRFQLRRRVLDGLERGLLDEPRALARLFAEPVQAPAAFAHHRMCLRMKADGIGVALSGSGGDEALAGYEWDFWPAAKRVLRAEGLGWEAKRYQLVLELGSLDRARRSLARRLRALLPSSGREDPSKSPTAAGKGAAGRSGSQGGAGSAPELLRRFESLDYDARRAYHLRVAHLPYYLASNDRATLGIPLEHRQPFLDHRVVELGLRMPVAHLFHRGWTKYVLRRAMRDALPPEILWRREKVGFPFPVRRLLDGSEAVLRRAFDSAAGHGLDLPPVGAFDDVLSTDPGRLWRRCSVGLWLDALG